MPLETPQPHSRPDRPSRVDLVIPVLNEAHVLERSVNEVRAFLATVPHYDWRIVIVDNGSTDGTDAVARRLVASCPAEVQFMQLPQRGRGRALRQAWSASDADVLCYTDVDLSTELAALPKLVSAILERGCGVATGSRLMRGSRTKRSVKREIISRCYNLLVKGMLRVSFSDAQCGFKAVSREVVTEIVPEVRDQSWFFDTELMVLAEKRGYRIEDVPVRWIEDDDSRVKIFRTAWDDVKGLMRVRWSLWRQSMAGEPRRSVAVSKRPAM
jgi:glycosyltransferase involved in cell wall biosynthesis